MVMAKTASLNATSRTVLRCTAAGSALAPNARTVASEPTQRIIVKTPAAPRDGDGRPGQWSLADGSRSLG
jgi:hypothetical protein